MCLVMYLVEYIWSRWFSISYKNCYQIIMGHSYGSKTETRVIEWKIKSIMYVFSRYWFTLSMRATYQCQQFMLMSFANFIMMQVYVTEEKKFRFLSFQANKSRAYYPNTKVWSIVDVKFGIEYDSTILVIYHDLIYIQQKYYITNLICVEVYIPASLHQKTMRSVQ